MAFKLLYRCRERLLVARLVRGAQRLLGLRRRDARQRIPRSLLLSERCKPDALYLGHLGGIIDVRANALAFRRYYLIERLWWLDALKSLLEKAGLPEIRFHDLRHSSATMLLGMKVHPKIVQELLGHSQIAITLDIYSHVLPTMQEEAMNKIDEALGV